jgi:hypothetical protein
MNSTDFIFEEVDRINAEKVQGEQSIMVQHDMKAWAVENGHWPATIYGHIIDAHAIARGWSQEGFTGLEMPHAIDS